MKNWTPIAAAVFLAALPSAAWSAPTITQIQNNYTYLVEGVPNYGVAPGTLFLIQGTGLANATTQPVVLQSTVAPGLPATLNGASVAVTVNGVTVHPAFYYALPTQLAVVLPSSTPVGAGTVVVTVGGVPSASAPISVNLSALGLGTYDGTGTGMAIATSNSTGALFNVTNSAAPGQIVVLWGSGLGADIADSDTVFTATPHPIDNLSAIYIGGVPATIAYQGASGYPGVNQIDVTIPPGVPLGCDVAVVGVSGSYVTNTVSLPIAAQAGGICMDPLLGIDGSTLVSAAASTNYVSASLQLSRQNIPQDQANPTINGSTALFYQVLNPNPPPFSGGGFSLGSCFVFAPPSPNVTSSGTYIGLDAGTLTVTGPAGTQSVPNQPGAVPGVPSGTYDTAVAFPPSFIPAAGGTFTFKASGGTTTGASVGAFQAAITLADPIAWTNMNAVTSVNRGQALPITWTGGAPGTYVQVSGYSFGTGSGVQVTFDCYAPASAGQFTVPNYILESLPAGMGGMSVEDFTPNQSFTGGGITEGFFFAYWGINIGENNSLPFN